MAIKSIIISLISKDLLKTQEFYTNVLNLKVTKEDFILYIESKCKNLIMFIEEDKFKFYTKRAGLLNQNPSLYTNAIISIELNSEKYLDKVLNTTEDYNGLIVTTKAETPFGFNSFIKDPSGNLIELVVISKSNLK